MLIVIVKCINCSNIIVHALKELLNPSIIKCVCAASVLEDYVLFLIPIRPLLSLSPFGCGRQA